MSNLTYIRTKIRNREYLQEALKNLGFTIQEGSALTISNYYETRSVDFIASDPHHAQSVGFFQNSDGEYSIATSTNLGINQQVIENEVLKIENHIKREYARTIVKQKLAAQGFFLVSESDTNDSIVIKLTRIV